MLHGGDSARRKERNVTLLDSTLDRLKERSALRKEKRKKRTCCTEETATGLRSATLLHLTGLRSAPRKRKKKGVRAGQR